MQTSCINKNSYKLLPLRCRKIDNVYRRIQKFSLHVKENASNTNKCLLIKNTFLIFM